jgi:hypothetical protein
MDANTSSLNTPEFSAKGLVRKWSRYFGAISGLGGPDMGIESRTTPSQTRSSNVLFSAAEPKTITSAPETLANGPSTTTPSPSEPLREDMGGVQDAPDDPQFQKEKNQCQKWINIVTNDSLFSGIETSDDT